MCLIPLHPQSLSVHFNLDCTFGQTGKDYHTPLQYYFKCTCFKVIKYNIQNNWPNWTLSGGTG